VITAKFLSWASFLTAGSRVRGEADADQRLQGATERARVDDGAVAGDDAPALQPPDPVAGGVRGQPDASPQLLPADPAVPLELADDLTVDRV
jgi:hypothetical protein